MGPGAQPPSSLQSSSRGVGSWSPELGYTRVILVHALGQGSGPPPPKGPAPSCPRSNGQGLAWGLPRGQFQLLGARATPCVPCFGFSPSALCSSCQPPATHPAQEGCQPGRRHTAAQNITILEGGWQLRPEQDHAESVEGGGSTLNRQEPEHPVSFTCSLVGLFF